MLTPHGLNLTDPQVFLHAGGLAERDGGLLAPWVSLKYIGHWRARGPLWEIEFIEEVQRAGASASAEERRTKSHHKMVLRGSPEIGFATVTSTFRSPDFTSWDVWPLNADGRAGKRTEFKAPSVR